MSTAGSSLNMHESRRLGPCKLSWISLDFLRLLWATLELIEFLWIPLKFLGFSWISLDPLKLHWISVDFLRISVDFVGHPWSSLNLLRTTLKVSWIFSDFLGPPRQHTQGTNTLFGPPLNPTKICESEPVQNA